MSDIISFSVLHEKVLNAKEDFDANSTGTAFDRLALQIILRLNDDEIEDAITDGSLDGGIDAIHITNQAIHFFNFKYTDEFEKTKANFPETEVDKIIVTIEQFYGKSLNRQTVNNLIWEKYEEVVRIFNDGPRNIHIHLASNKRKPVPHAQIKLENALSKYRLVHFHYYDLEDLVSKIVDDRKPKIDGKLTFLERQHFEKSDGPIKTVIGAVAATDLIELIRSPSDSSIVNEDIFDENVRVYKAKHDINTGIKASAKADSNYEFFYLNNGITILCEECGYIPNTRSPRVELKNLQIINGGQTSHSLFEAYKEAPDKVQNVEVLVRVCVAKKDSQIAEKISKTSNTQIPVVSRDLRANEPIQRQLREAFEALGYYYESKPNQYIDKPATKRINNELLGQIYMAYELDMPSEAKDDKSLVFGGKYDEIFNKDKITADKLLAMYKIYLPILERKKEIQRSKRRKEGVKESESFISWATFHILNAVKLIIENRVTEIKASSKTKSEIDSEVRAIYQREITSVTDEAIECVGTVVQQARESQGEGYSHSRFFKETQTNKLIRDYVLKRLT